MLALLSTLLEQGLRLENRGDAPSFPHPPVERGFEFVVAGDVVGLVGGDGDAAAGAVLEVEENRSGAGVFGEDVVCVFR
jgi:hypothetical protein